MNTQKITAAAAAVTFAAPNATDTVEVGRVLVVKNASAGAITVTLVTEGNLPTGIAYPDTAVSVPAGGERWVLVGDPYRSATDPGLATVTYSATASVTAAVVAV